MINIVIAALVISLMVGLLGIGARAILFGRHRHRRSLRSNAPRS